MRRGKLKCSFCGKTADEVSKLVAGPRIVISRIHICDECVALINQIMSGESLSDMPTSKKSGSFLAKLKWRWLQVLRIGAIHEVEPEAAS